MSWSLRRMRTAGGTGGTIRGAVAAATLITLLPIFFCSTIAHADDTLRCGSRLVSVEAIAAQVQAVCGEPAYRDQWFFSQPLGSGYSADVEVWYYNFGPSRLLQMLKFRNDRLVDIQSDGYGFYGDGAGRCAPSAIGTGTSKFRLLAECGEPSSKRAENLLTPAQNPLNGRNYGYPNHYAVQSVYREHWVYNFGSRYLLREVTLENGRVSEVENGERGFDSQ